jgi:protein-S-isoprenylcysteine O-methyltransferase Ste14
MTIEQTLWVWFLLNYALGMAGFLRNVVRVGRYRAVFEVQIGHLPPVDALIAWLLPPLILLSRAGAISAERPIIRAIGIGLSLYAIVMVTWTARTLGRFLVPGLAVFRDHVLVTSGPFRLVRHPLYSGALALWLGAALGTLNWLLLALWPLLVAAVFRELPAEEGMLRTKFGATYNAYAARTGRFIPKVRWRELPKD